MDVESSQMVAVITASDELQLYDMTGELLASEKTCTHSHHD